MKAGSGKGKGSGFERLICHELSLWISRGEHDDLFWRSSLSGGRATVMFKKGGQNRTQCGDITAIHPDGNPLTDQYLISCKFYHTLNFQGAITGSKNGLSAFWTECVEEAKRYGKIPMLIAKQNNIKPVVGLNSVGVTQFKVTGKYVALLPISGGLSLFWLEAFLKYAVRPNGIITRPRILIQGKRGSTGTY